MTFLFIIDNLEFFILIKFYYDFAIIYLINKYFWNEFNLILKKRF